MGGGGVPARRGGAHSGGMDSCLRRNDGGGWGEVGRATSRSPLRGRGGGVGGSRLGGGCAFRRDGFLPPQE